MQDLDQFKQTFFQECEDLLEQLEGDVSRLSVASDPTEAIDAAFRAIHSIKGGAGMFGLARLVALSHAIESALVEARGQRIHVDDAFISVMLHAADILSDVANAARSGKALADDFETECFDQLATLAIAGRRSGAGRAQRMVAPIVAEARARAAVATYRIRYEPAADIFRRGLEPLTIISGLSLLGDVTTKADLDKLPDFLDLDPAVAYVAWTFNLESAASLVEIKEVFAFISSDCRLEIETIAEPAAPPTDDAEAAELVAVPKPIDAWSPPDYGPATSIRVDLDRVERLVNAVGEVSIVQSMVLQHLDQTIIDANPHLYRALTQLLQLTRGLQDGVMAIRAQPIRSIFSRMPRIVRDAALQTGKKARLELRGEGTEIDKTIIEQISDPLMHIVRNAIDHGVEQPAERRAAGKPEAGLITLDASQRGGRIVIEVSDDGRGIDRAAVRKRATDLRLIDEESALFDHEIDNLVFRPGLSTASAVSDMSGRGVGMDVVFKNIQKLGGRVSIRSEPGVGTTTTIVLPLTLAVLDSMLVRTGQDFYLIPLANIVECVVASRSDIGAVPGTGEFLNVRGRQMAVFDLSERLQIKGSPALNRAPIVLVEVQSRGVVGLIVDEICGHRQVVIKSLREHFQHVDGLAGATILGDGRVAFILDVEELASRAACRFLPSGDFNSKREAFAA